MLCGNKKSSKSSYKKQIKSFQKKFRFPENKLVAYIDRFNRIGNLGGFSKEEFRENMGLLGLDSTCLIANRIFTVMNKSQSGTVTLREYLEYMDILLYGSPDEKSEQSFKLITNNESEGITFEDFVDWMVNIWKMYNSLTGCEINSSQEDIKYYFDKFDRNQDGIIDIEEYKEAMMENKNMYEWFEFANRGIADESPAQEIDSGTYKKALQLISKELESCLEVLTSSDRNSKAISKGSFGFPALRSRPSAANFDDEDLDSDRPLFNRGDEDLPEEIIIDESRNTMGGMQGKLNSLLVKVELLLKEKELTVKKEQSAKADAFPVMQRIKSNNPGKVGERECNLIYNMMIGVQRAVKIAISGYRHDDDLTPSDFLEKSEIPLIKSNNIDNNNIYKFKDYAAGIFERLRREYEISGDDYIQSLGVEKIVHSIVVNDFSYFTGKIGPASNGFFFFSTDDQRFLLKTISPEEFKCTREMLTDYFYHAIKNHNSFLAKLLGIHRITTQSNKKHYFIIMTNFFPKGYEISEIYDLQGLEVQASNQDMDVKVKKDLEFNRAENKICVGEQLRKFILQQIRKDCEFLSGMKINGYSFVVGIHEVTEELTYKDMWISEDRRFAYFMGIVDFMTQYSHKKIKNLFNKNKMLNARPKDYCERLLVYLDSIIV